MLAVVPVCFGIAVQCTAALVAWQFTKPSEQIEVVVKCEQKNCNHVMFIKDPPRGKEVTGFKKKICGLIIAILSR